MKGNEVKRTESYNLKQNNFPQTNQKNKQNKERK